MNKELIKKALNYKNMALNAAMPGVALPAMNTALGAIKGPGAWEGFKSGMKYAPLAMAGAGLGDAMAQKGQMFPGLGLALASGYGAGKLADRDLNKKLAAKKSQPMPKQAALKEEIKSLLKESQQTVQPLAQAGRHLGQAGKAAVPVAQELGRAASHAGKAGMQGLKQTWKNPYGRAAMLVGGTLLASKAAKKAREANQHREMQQQRMAYPHERPMY